MARLTFVKKAQKNIYTNGKYVSYKSKKGKRAGQMLNKHDRTVPENSKDKVFIAAGESYYWWQFKNGPKHYSKERPRNSQLTQSAYLGDIYDFQDELGELRFNVSSADDLVSAVDDIKSRLEKLRDEQEEKKDNMPESLQESPSGELLQERYDSLDNAINELDCLDLDYDEPTDEDLRSEAIEELQLDEDDEESLQDKETEINEAIERIREEKLSEWLDEKCGEVSGISFD